MSQSTTSALSWDKPSPDAKALRLTRCLQESTGADVAILFGSRARGDYVEGRSDVDILLVDDRAPTPQRRKDAHHEAGMLAQEIYRQPTTVQVLWFDHDTFGKMRRTVNHVVARAVQEGIVMPSNPENYSSRYNAENDDESYEWTVTDQRVRNAESHLNNFRILHEGGGDDRGHGKNAQEGMEHALKAVISAAGAHYPREHNISVLTDLANAADPGLNFQPSIEPRILNQYAGSDDYYDPAEPITNIPDYYEAIRNDITTLLNRARELQRP